MPLSARSAEMVAQTSDRAPLRLSVLIRTLKRIDEELLQLIERKVL